MKRHVECDWCCLWGHCSRCILLFKLRGGGGFTHHWTKELYRRRQQQTHENLMTDLRMSEPNDYRIFCGWMVHQLTRYSILLPLQLLKEILICEKLSLSVSIYLLQDAIWTVKCFQRHKIHKCHISSIYWNYCAGDVFMNIVQSCWETIQSFLFLRTVHFCVITQPFRMELIRCPKMSVKKLPLITA